MNLERTLVLLKPDSIERGLMGRIISRFEDKGLRITGLKMLKADTELLTRHYAHLKDQPFFPDILKFMLSGPIVAMCVEGLDVINVVRSMCGITKSREAAPGTIRGDLAMSVRTNLVHASDSPENAREELARFFSDAEIFSHVKLLDSIIYIDKQK